MNAAVLCLTMCQLLPAAADPQDSVVAGREALDGFWGYPWYDSANDEVRRVEIPDPPSWSPIRQPGWLDMLLGYLAWIVLILALVGLAYLLIQAYLGREARSAASAAATESSADEDADRIEALPLPVQRGRSDLLGEARRHYRQGDYGQAIVYLFSFQLVQLDKQQVIRLTKGKTNRQYLREVGPRASLRRLLEQSMVAFEDVFFGHRTLDRARFESCWSRLDEFQSLAGEAAG